MADPRISISWTNGFHDSATWKFERGSMQLRGGDRLGERTWCSGAGLKWPWVSQIVLVNIPGPTKMGGEFTYQPKWDPIGFDPQPSERRPELSQV